MFQSTVITFIEKGEPFWIDMAFCVSMKMSGEALVCSFVDGQEYTFHEKVMKGIVEEAFKLAKGYQ